MVLVKYIKDWWTSRKFSRQAQEYYRWLDRTVVRNAGTIENMFVNFKYILPVSNQILDHSEPFGWVPSDEFSQYMYPNRNPCDSTVWFYARGFRDPYDGKFHFSDIRSEQDQIFAATNNEQDAIMIALRWSS